MNYDWNFSVLLNQDYQELLLLGLRTTLLLTACCVVVGTPLGIFLGSLPFVDRLVALEAPSPMESRLGLRRLLRPLRHALLVLLARTSVILVDVVRAIPLLLLMLTFYYVLPVLAQSFGFEVSSFATVAAAMGLNLSAFIADLVRGAAAAVSRGDLLAARSLGMGQFLTWRRIVLPQVFREILPGLGLLYISMLKMSTLASAVTIYEVLHSAEAIIQKTYRPLELYVAICGLFIALVLPLAYFARLLERSRFFLRRS